MYVPQCELQTIHVCPIHGQTKQLETRLKKTLEIKCSLYLYFYNINLPIIWTKYVQVILSLLKNGQNANPNPNPENEFKKLQTFGKCNTLKCAAPCFFAMFFVVLKPLACYYGTGLLSFKSSYLGQLKPTVCIIYYWFIQGNPVSPGEGNTMAINGHIK